MLHSCVPAFTVTAIQTSTRFAGTALKTDVCKRRAHITTAKATDNDNGDTSSENPSPTSQDANAPGKTRATRRPKSKRPSAFEETIENLTMKRMGRGTIYYGERPDYSAEDGGEDEGDDMETLKPDAVLVTGATGRTGQWITLGLLNQEFNVRSMTRKFGRAERLFGPSGSNIDVFECDITRLDQVTDAVDQAVCIVCASGASRWIPGGFSSVDVSGVSNLVQCALKQPSMSLFVLISSVDSSGGRGKAKREAETLVMESGLPYVIFRVSELVDGAGGSNQIVMNPIFPDADVPSAIPSICRVDLAQCVCQAIVHHRKIARMNEASEDAEFEFPNCVISAHNSTDSLRMDKRFWTSSFNRIGDAFRPPDTIDDEEAAQ